MAATMMEVDSFIGKFKQLWKSGFNANLYRREKEKEEKENDYDWEEIKREEESWKYWRKRNWNKRKIKGKGKKKKWTKKEVWGEDKEDNENYIPSPSPEKEKFQTVIFVQHTQHSKLASNIREKLAELEKVGKLKIKIVERSGMKLVDLLHKSNVWGDTDCMREECWNCSELNEGSKKGACYKKNIVYETYCITCQEIEEEEKEREDKRKKETGREGEEEGERMLGAVPSRVGILEDAIIESRTGAVPNLLKKKDKERKEECKKKESKRKDYKVKYIGESSRSLYERSCEHRDDFENLNEKSHILKHYVIAHSDLPREKLRFGIRIRHQYKKAFERQIGEAISIEQEMKKGTILLNSKSEFNRCSVPRLIMGTYKENLEEMKKEDKENKKIKDEIRKLKKRKQESSGDLLEICKEMSSENYVKWKKRKIVEESKWDEIQRIERQNWERTQRKNKANQKKKELLEKIERKKKKGKSLEWILRSKKKRELEKL